MMHRQKVKLLLWFATLLSVLALVVAPALAIDVFTLNVEKAGDGTGTVTSDDGKINCGEVCVATYGGATGAGKLTAFGVQVTLTATPDEGFAFATWSGNCVQQAAPAGAGSDPAGAVVDPTNPVIEFTMDANRTCTATFGLPVGGIAVPVNRLGLLMPWPGLAALAGLAGVLLLRAQRRR